LQSESSDDPRYDLNVLNRLGSQSLRVLNRRLRERRRGRFALFFGFVPVPGPPRTKCGTRLITRKLGKSRAGVREKKIRVFGKTQIGRRVKPKQPTAIVAAKNG
jgi:hypothetical protein